MSTRTVVFDAENLDATRAALLAETADGETVVDLSRVDRLRPDALELLEHAGQQALQAGSKLALRGVDPVVYKAMQVARVAVLYRRV